MRNISWKRMGLWRFISTHLIGIDQRFSYWDPRNPAVPQRCVRGSEKWKCVMALAVLNMYVGTEIRVATLDTDHSVTDSTQTIHRCFHPEAFWFCSQVSQQSSPMLADVSAETIRVSIILKLTIEFLNLMCMKEKQMLVFYFTFGLLRTSWGPSVSSVALLGFHELK